MKSKKNSSSKSVPKKPTAKAKASNTISSVPAKKMKPSIPHLKQASKSDMESDIIKLII